MEFTFLMAPSVLYATGIVILVVIIKTIIEFIP